MFREDTVIGSQNALSKQSLGAIVNLRNSTICRNPESLVAIPLKRCLKD